MDPVDLTIVSARTPGTSWGGKPGWYDHLWVHREQLAARWMICVARLLRDEDIDASPANVIESVRLADSLAVIRGRQIAGLDELGEATLSVLCHGNPMPVHLIRRKLVVGQRIGQVPDAVPMVPLQRDLVALQKSLRLKVSADEMTLDLDQRKENDLTRSHLLHRLRLLGVEWGELQDDQRQRSSTFHEIWKLQWRPEFAVRIIEAAQWGNTVADAARASVTHRATSAKDLAELTALLDDVILADLPGAVERLLAENSVGLGSFDRCRAPVDGAAAARSSVALRQRASNRCGARRTGRCGIAGPDRGRTAAGLRVAR